MGGKFCQGDTRMSSAFKHPDQCRPPRLGHGRHPIAWKKAMTMTLARVLLAEDHSAVAEQLHALLKTEFDVVAVVGDGCALLGAFQSLRPDVVVTDIAMPGIDGLAAATRILGQDHGARIVLVSVHDEPALVQAALDAGVLGYVSKSKAGEELLPAVHAAVRGERHVPVSPGPDA